MPNDLANQVSEDLNKKTIPPQDELQDALGDMARDIALIEPDPQHWAGWVIYFIDRLAEESQKRRREFDFNSIREELVNELQDRMSTKMS